MPAAEQLVIKGLHVSVEGQEILKGVDLTIGRGEGELRVRTADGVREPQNRRVEIRLSPVTQQDMQGQPPPR
jgi:hypothetical protein